MYTNIEVLFTSSYIVIKCIYCKYGLSCFWTVNIQIVHRIMKIMKIQMDDICSVHIGVVKDYNIKCAQYNPLMSAVFSTAK